MLLDNSILQTARQCAIKTRRASCLTPWVCCTGTSASWLQPSNGCLSSTGSSQHSLFSGKAEKPCVSAVQALFPPDKTANFFMDITLEDADGAKIQE